MVGFIVGRNMDPIRKPKIIKETKVDTVFRSKIVKVEIEKSVNHIDTVFIVSDTINFKTESLLLDTAKIKLNSVASKDSLQIKRDLIIGSDTLYLIKVTPDIKDTLKEKLLGVKTINQERVLIEYWESPLSYLGYKLSKSKLIVYGVLPIKKSRLYKFEKKYYLKMNNLFYNLNETNTFKNLVVINKPSFIYD